MEETWGAESDRDSHGGFPMQRADALKNPENTPSVFIIPFQLASFTQGNEEISLWLSPSDRYIQ